MANKLGVNPIYLDTFTAALDLGSSLFGDSNAAFKLSQIRWVEATAAATALITDGAGNNIFDDTCSADNVDHVSDFGGSWVRGIKIAQSGVSAGKILIYLY